MPEETVQTPEQADAEFEKELTSLMTPETAPEVQTAADATATPPETPTPVEATEPPAAEPTLDEKLAKIEEPPATKVEAPQLAPDQQKILQAIPDLQTAQQVVSHAESYRQLDSALSSGDFGKVEQMLAPPALQAFHEHIYQQNIEKWVERWLADKEGNPQVNQSVKNLERQIQDLRTQRDNEERQRLQYAHQQKVAEVGKQYDTHIKQLFDMIEFADADRRWVRAAIDKLVGEDRTALHAINNGQMSAINPLFKQAVKEYVQRDQTNAQTKAQKQELEAKHKPLIGGSAITPVNDEVTDEMIRSAPAAQRDALIEKQYEQQLSALFSTKKKK